MPRRVFFSFDFDDVWRVNQIRNIGAISDEDKPCTPNEIEEVRKQSDEAIKRWIHEQMHGRSCVAVLIGPHTRHSKWVLYEIEYGWNQGKGVFGIYIHNLRDQHGKTAIKGQNPFSAFELEVHNFLGQPQSKTIPFDSVARVYDPPSENPVSYIAERLETWIEDAIQTRNAWAKSQLRQKP